jgi:hypothetical protein
VVWNPQTTHASSDSQARTIATIALAVSLAIAATVGGFFFLAMQDDAVLTFTYRVELELNGTGEVRVSLPIPVPEALLAGLVVTPVSSTFLVNRSGAEPALDVTLHDRTWINATSTVPWEFYNPVDADLTRTDPWGSACPCVAEIALAGITGNVTAIRLRMDVAWSGACESPRWSLDASVPRGVHGVTGTWVALVC